MAETAADMRSGGSGRKTYGFIRLHQFSSRQADTALLNGELLFARQERAVITERLVEQRLDECCPTMSSADKPSVFKAGEVSTNAGG